MKSQKFVKSSQQNNQRQLQMSMIKKYLKKDMYLQKKDKNVYPEERQEIFDELRLKQYNNEISKNHKSYKKFTTK